MLHLFRIIIYKFFKTFQKNNFAITELFLNIVQGRDSLNTGYEVWEGIIKNYETDKFLRDFTNHENNVSLEEMIEQKKAEKKNQEKERAWTPEDDTMLHAITSCQIMRR